MDSSFAAFIGISAVVIMTPGQDTALTIRNNVLGRPRIRRAFDAAMGAILVAFGVRLAIERPA